MMARPLELEDFNTVDAPIPIEEVYDGERLEAERLEAFDKGYSAGWDDSAEAAQREAQSRGAALDSRMEELSFTFHEARAHVMRGLAPLIEAIVETAVPRILHGTLGPRLTDAIGELAEGCSNPEIRILTAPDNTAAVTAALGDRPRFPVAVEETASLSPGVIQLRLGDRGREIDLSAIEGILTDALAALDIHNEEILSHG